ncbi:MAG: hypothetical protein Q8Q12_02090 [bacterium]|nr:hypothetical protein [bacterium]
MKRKRSENFSRSEWGCRRNPVIQQFIQGKAEGPIPQCADAQGCEGKSPENFSPSEWGCRRNPIVQQFIQGKAEGPIPQCADAEGGKAKP